MRIPVSLPLDSGGYLRRECPQCAREFKWHHGPIAGVPDQTEQPEVYYCPYCGEPAALDQWYTKQQIETIRSAAIAAILPKVHRELEEAVSDLNGTGFVEATVKSNTSGVPPPLIEGDDMQAVASPCHPYEPVKILES